MDKISSPAQENGSRETPAPEGVGIGARFASPAEGLRDMRRAMESVFDPFGMASPIMHAQFA
jgi:hypothetical protein